jgi:hypothetical protein
MSIGIEQIWGVGLSRLKSKYGNMTGRCKFILVVETIYKAFEICRCETGS